MRYNNMYTGEGFKGERLLGVTALLLSVVSTILLIDLAIYQRKHTKMSIEEIEKRNGNK